DPQRAVSLWAIWTEHYAGQSAATFGHVAAESKQRGRLHSIDGWSGACETADVMHALWLGTGRDCVGSLLLDMAEYWDRCKPLATYDERLLVILHDFHAWCRESGARPSAVDEMSIFHQHH
ncbi:Cpr, partial [Symbiodinium pilosum]